MHVIVNIVIYINCYNILNLKIAPGNTTELSFLVTDHVTTWDKEILVQVQAYMCGKVFTKPYRAPFFVIP